jgi:hypothetical protein
MGNGSDASFTALSPPCRLGGKPHWNGTKAGFPVFYRSMAQGKTIEKALDNLQTASGHSQFTFVPGPSVQQLRQEVVNCKTPAEVHDVRDKYRLPSRRNERFSPVYPFKPLSRGIHHGGV